MFRELIFILGLLGIDVKKYISVKSIYFSPQLEHKKITV